MARAAVEKKPVISGRHRPFRSLALSSIGWGVLVVILYQTAFFLHQTVGFPYRRVELAMQDWVAKLARPAKQNPRLVFLVEDADSHNPAAKVWDRADIDASPALQLMEWKSWSREIWALALARLADAGARVVGFDYMLKGKDQGDEAFAAALEKYADRVVIGAEFGETDLVGGARIRPFIGPPPSLLKENPEDPRVGFVNVVKDEDDRIRRTRFRITKAQMSTIGAGADEVVYHSLPARVAQQAGLGGSLPRDLLPHPFRFAFKGKMAAHQGNLRSLWEIFDPGLWQANYQNGEFFRDKLVLIGPEGTWTKDTAETPFGTIAGAELHLNALNALLERELLTETEVPFDLLLIVLGALLAWLLGWWVQRPVLRLVLLLVGMSVWVAGAVALYNHGLVVPVFSPILSLGGAGFLFSAIEQVLDRAEKQRFRSTLERYVSRDIVRELLDNRGSFLNVLGGVRKDITLLFSDVRGFTTLTENADAQQLVLQLNEYFNVMVGIVFQHHGTLDKFIGDAVMSHWGGIVTEGPKLDACNAVSTAVEMRHALARLNADWKERGIAELHFGIGINHGEAIVGNLGCEAKMEVSAIGDCVNTASRLEGATKEYHVDLLIGASVAEFVREKFVLRSVDLLQVKGKTKPVEVFTVLGERNGSSTNPEWLASYEEGMRSYRAREFAAAVAQFEHAAALQPADWLNDEYLRRSRLYVAEPPGADWDGVYVLTRK